MKTAVLVLTIIGACFSLLMGIGAGACVQGVGELNRNVGNVHDANDADSLSGTLVLAGLAQFVVGGIGGLQAYRKFGTKSSLKWGLVPLVVAGLLSITNTCSFFTAGLMFFIAALLIFLGTRSPTVQPIVTDASTSTLAQPIAADASTSALESGLNTVGVRLKAAGQFAASQAQRTKLVTITLPSLYKALGRHLYSSKSYPEDFPDLYSEFERLSEQLKAIKTQAEARPAPDGIAAKTKAAAAGLKDAAQTKALDLRVNQAFAKLGAAAFDKIGAESGPSELVRPIAQARAQLAALDQEIAGLSKPEPGQVFTPKRITIAGVCLVLFIGLAILGNLAENNKDSHPHQTEVSHPNIDPGDSQPQDAEVSHSNADSDGEPEKAIEIVAPLLIHQFDANELRANRKFKGKILRVRGVVEDVKDMFGTPHVYLSGQDQLGIRRVDCAFKDDLGGDLQRLSQGQFVIIQGKCTGLFGNVDLENCELLK